MKLARALVRSLAVLGGLLVLVTVTPVVNWWAARYAGPWNDPKGDVLVVLAADVIADGMIGYSSYWRSVYAVRCWREGGFRQLVLSGRSDIAEPMRSFLVAEGVPADAIRVEGSSNSTRENAVNTVALLGPSPGRVVLLTSDFHMLRAHRAFRKAGLDPQPRPFPDALKRGQRWHLRWNVLLDLLTETAKLGYYTVRGWM